MHFDPTRRISFTNTSVILPVGLRSQRVKIASYAKTVTLIETVSAGFSQGQGDLSIGVKMKVLRRL